MNTKTRPKPPARRKRKTKASTPKRRLLNRVITGAASIGGMVAATGIAAVLGWA